MPRSLRLHLAQTAKLTGALLLMVASMTGCRQDMHDQPKMFPLRSTTFYPDGRSVRPQVAGTVARSQMQVANYFSTGLVDGAEGDGLPFKATLAVLERGQERYNVYCTPCHSRAGNGKGMIVQRGYYAATSFHSDRLREAPLGHFFSVISHGYGAMPDYAAQIAPQDRWAIAAYIRALQLSQNASRSDVPAGENVAPMQAVLERTGFPEDFLGSWIASSSASTPPPLPAAPAPAASTPAGAPSAGAIRTGGREGVSGAGAEPVQTRGSSAVATPVKSAAAPAAKGNVAHGKTLYDSNCSVCHQPTRAGMPPVFPSLIGIVDRVGEAKVRTVAKQGIPDAKPPMPPHPDFTEKDLTDLVAFLRTKP